MRSTTYKIVKAIERVRSCSEEGRDWISDYHAWIKRRTNPDDILLIPGRDSEWLNSFRSTSPAMGSHPTSRYSPSGRALSAYEVAVRTARTSEGPDFLMQAAAAGLYAVTVEVSRLFTPEYPDAAKGSRMFSRHMKIARSTAVALYLSRSSIEDANAAGL